jgi:RimJ/RimL family protein N-acetyltransferase
MSKHRFTGILETKRLILRPFEFSDASVMFQNWACDPDVMRYLPANVSETIEDVNNRLVRWFDYFKDIEPGKWGMFAIVLKSDDTVIGEIDYAEVNIVTGNAEVGYQIGKPWWG